MTEFEWRVLILGLIKGVYNEEETMKIIDAKKCCICGCIELEEYMHENDDGVYCETCWNSRN